jgi:hypothetical protein
MFPPVASTTRESFADYHFVCALSGQGEDPCGASKTIIRADEYRQQWCVLADSFVFAIALRHCPGAKLD